MTFNFLKKKDGVLFTEAFKNIPGKQNAKLRENGVMTKMSDVEAGIIKIGKEKEDARKNVES